MGEILGIGTTHYPGLTGTDEGLCSIWQRIINAPRIDPSWKDEVNWPDGMSEEIGADKGLSSAGEYRQRMWDSFQKQRKIIETSCSEAYFFEYFCCSDRLSDTTFSPIL